MVHIMLIVNYRRNVREYFSAIIPQNVRIKLVFSLGWVVSESLMLNIAV